MSDPRRLDEFSATTKAGAPVASCPYASRAVDYCNLERIEVDVSTVEPSAGRRRVSGRVQDVLGISEKPGETTRWLLDGQRVSRPAVAGGKYLHPDQPLQLVVRSPRWPARTVSARARHSIVCGGHRELIVGAPEGIGTHPQGSASLALSRDRWSIDDSVLGNLSFLSLFSAAWNSFFAEPKRYALTVSSCGVPVPGDDAPAIRLLSLPVECYPADSFSLAIEVTPFSFSKSGEIRKGLHDDTAAEKDVARLLDASGITPDESAFSKLVKKIEFSHTDGDRVREVDFADLDELRPMNGLRKLLELLLLLPRMLQAGRAGFFIDADYVACGLQLDAEWGYEENGQLVRRAFSCSLAFTLLRGTVEVGVGYRFPKLCEVSLAIVLEVGVGLEGVIERKDADADTVIALRNKRTFSAGLKAIGDAGWLFALEGTASCPFTFEMGVAYHLDGGALKFDVAIDREACTINFKATNGLVGEWGYEYPLFEKQRLMAHP